MSCKRVINCALVIIVALFQNVVLSFDVEKNLYTWSSFWVEIFPFTIAVNTLRPRRNEQHFADDIFKRIFFNENV